MSYLDELAKHNPVMRLTWPYEDGAPAPNDYCNLVDVGIYQEILVWEENDDHFRKRIKGLLCRN